MLPPLTQRYYSISPSPLVDRRRCSIKVAVLNGAALSGHGDYHGTCSSYLAGYYDAGRVVAALIRDNHSRFRLPDNPAIPLIMVGPGTGLAPFRGFLQERAALKAAGRTIGPAMLFFGCRRPDQDFIYEDELRAFEASGVCELYVAFSRYGPAQRVHVQQLIRDCADKVMALLDRGGLVYVCGDASRMRPTFAAPLLRSMRADSTSVQRLVGGGSMISQHKAATWSTCGPRPDVEMTTSTRCHDSRLLTLRSSDVFMFRRAVVDDNAGLQHDTLLSF
jgi:cytochrome P450/NADPH-cytochrome P450 reductase